MLALMTATHGIECSECGRKAVMVAVNLPNLGFVTHLCPPHLAAFVQDWMDSPGDACKRHTIREIVKADR